MEVGVGGSCDQNGSNKNDKKKITSHKPEGTWKAGRPKPRLPGKLPNNILVSKMKRWWQGPNNKESACVVWHSKVTGGCKPRDK